ncbi:gluconokinase [Chroococcus sp. FPU101]|uniref:gluconokinase n=1 Tax=Chroococcus sp. FPU101 TaxID=1974212 RepID=UPI001A8C721C|nr:gluconokinase [Chroococcus sp. FPU101]GFE68014.1 carbohydrate kinase, thermoresistant glucokinase family [Chroococcus sp. FPU101]
MICILMGVSGSGKSTIGQLLSQKLGWPFYDGDDFHPRENIAKMRQGIPLTDEDRRSWLSTLRSLIEQNQNAIIACSSLKESYRDYLEGERTDIVWIYLKGSYEEILERMQHRQGHFMQPQMLRSQFATLEEPKNALVIDISLLPEEIIDRIVNLLD